MKYSLRNVRLVVFDLDGTLTESKSPLAPDMRAALRGLLAEKKVAVIGGGSWEQFQWQFVDRLKCPPALLSNLFLFPTTSMAFYRHSGRAWKNVYRKTLSNAEWRSIKGAFEKAFKEAGFVPPARVYGEIIENRGSQATFSPLGQEVVTVLGKKGVRLKEEWRKENEELKIKIARLVQKSLPKFEVRRGGITSIDVTKKGIDKAYGVRRIEKTLHIPIKEMVFIGDALYRGGNDAAAKKTGVRTIPTSGPEETKRIIGRILED